MKKREVEQMRSENSQLKSNYESLTSEVRTVRSNLSSGEKQDLLRLNASLSELRVRKRNLTERKTVLVRKTQTTSMITETLIQKDPRVEQLKRRLKSLIQQNNSLVN
ncbi:MAG: hypothetical protein GY928_35950 [Colwellia sp.]|nr:hypothetical protein [Colwellia sp.]